MSDGLSGATEHAQQLRDALAAYLKAGRRVSSGSRRPARGGRRGPASGLNTTEVREWAKARGIEVKDRGRVPAELVVKFKAATTASKVHSTPRSPGNGITHNAATGALKMCLHEVADRLVGDGDPALGCGG
jgi:hypothetical protein